MFLTIGAANNDIKANEDFADNHGHILRFPVTLTNVYFHHKLNQATS